jgi:hypothetical protein
MANLTSSSARTSAGTCSGEDEFRAALESLYDIPIVGDVRATATSTPSSWSKTRTPRST